MAKTEFKEGNQCVFLMFTAFNFLNFLTSLAMLGVSIWMWAILKSANIFILGFIIASITLVLLASCAFKLKKSPKTMKCYLYI